MGYRWPTDTAFAQRLLTVEQQVCDLCQRRLHICDHRFHRIHTFEGPVEIVCKLAHCPNPHCPGAHQTLSPLAEAQLTLPHWTIGWDVFCWLGHRRFARHWSIPQLRLELRDTYQIALSDDALTDYVRHYQLMVAARQQDATQLAAAYRDLDALILTIDGLQPEKGHETLYVVRELRAKRVWFAEALLSSTTAEVQRLVAKAKQWAQQLGKPVRLWMSDKQEAFLQAVAAEFPEVPHRYCQNHFVRDVAKPVLAADSQAKVTMRQKVRGLRAIERDLLAPQQTPAAAEARVEAPAAAEAPAVPPAEAARVALDYCAAVRGILNDDQGGPLQPPGLRMAAALTEVRASLQRNLDAKKGGARRNLCRDSPAVSTVACKR
jgi:MULE transposase domain